MWTLSAIVNNFCTLAGANRVQYVLSSDAINRWDQRTRSLYKLYNFRYQLKHISGKGCFSKAEQMCSNQANKSWLLVSCFHLQVHDNTMHNKRNQQTFLVISSDSGFCSSIHYAIHLTISYCLHLMWEIYLLQCFVQVACNCARNNRVYYSIWCIEQSTGAAGHGMSFQFLISWIFLYLIVSLL